MVMRLAVRGITIQSTPVADGALLDGQSPSATGRLVAFTLLSHQPVPIARRAENRPFSRNERRTLACFGHVHPRSGCLQKTTATIWASPWQEYVIPIPAKETAHGLKQQLFVPFSLSLIAVNRIIARDSILTSRKKYASP